MSLAERLMFYTCEDDQRLALSQPVCFHISAAVLHRVPEDCRTDLCLGPEDVCTWFAPAVRNS
jgi:hypothetical protein